jgi:hypothetical protein
VALRAKTRPGSHTFEIDTADIAAKKAFIISIKFAFWVTYFDPEIFVGMH